MPETIPADGDRTTSEMLLEWDRRRPRSQQTELGMSEIGECRRRAGYRLAGTPPTNPSGSVQAVLGTAIHDAIERVFHDLQADGAIPPEDLVEHEVRYAGILGHLDRFHTATGTLEDTKSTSQRWLDHIMLNGPSRAHVWQLHLYGAALLVQGHEVRRLVIAYIARDTGTEHRVEIDFDPTVVKAALAWLEQVRTTPLDYLDRDHDPESTFCQHCPFLGDCWGDPVDGRDRRAVLLNPDRDAVFWAQELWEARQAKKSAAEREDRAKGALDAVRPVGDATVDVGYERLLRWSTSVQKRLDMGQVRKDYRKAGVAPPENELVITKLSFAPKEEK